MNSWRFAPVVLLVGWCCDGSARGQDVAKRIDDVIRQQRENEARHAARIAPVVERQLQINHPDDPALARQMFDSWKAAHLVQGQAAESAARAHAAQRTTTDPAEHKARKEEARAELQVLRHAQSQVGAVIDHVEGLLQGTSPDAAPHRSRGKLVLPTAEDGLLLFQLSREDLDLRAADSALRQADAIRRAAEAANSSNLERSTAPGTAPGTHAERMIKALQDQYDSGLTDAVRPVVDFQPDDVGGRVPNPAVIQSVMAALAACQARIANHNARMPNPPSASLSEADFKYWEGVINSYNAEARALNEERAELYGRLDAETR